MHIESLIEDYTAMISSQACDDYLLEDYFIRERGLSWDLSREEQYYQDPRMLEIQRAVLGFDRNFQPPKKRLIGNNNHYMMEKFFYDGAEFKKDYNPIFIHNDPSQLMMQNHYIPNSIYNINTNINNNHVKVENNQLSPERNQFNKLSEVGVMPTLPYQRYTSGDGKIGAYTKEQRRLILEKYFAKRQRKVWSKQIKYDCRKKLADNRPRVKGRFVSRKRFHSLDLDADCSGLVDCDESHEMRCSAENNTQDY